MSLGALPRAVAAGLQLSALAERADNGVRRGVACFGFASRGTEPRHCSAQTSAAWRWSSWPRSAEDTLEESDDLREGVVKICTRRGARGSEEGGSAAKSRITDLTSLNDGEQCGAGDTPSPLQTNSQLETNVL